MSENTNTALEISSETRAIQHAANEVLSMKFNVFKQGVHYGEPFKGSGKATLLKPGAEMLMSRFGLWPHFIERGCVEDFDKPLFHYRYECRLMRVDTGAIAGAGIGSCNSMEDKYRWRKADRVCPNCGEPKIIKSKYPDRRTGEIGWYCLACKTSYAPTDPAITGQEAGRVANDDVFSLVNTLDKMAQKRSLIAAVLVATGASAWFTQDVEDFTGYEGVIVDAEDVTPIEPVTPRNVDQHGEVTRDDPAPIVPPIKTDADRAADRETRRLTRRLTPAPAGNGRADVSTHNPPVESMAAEMPQQALDAAHWTHEPGRINKMVAWARETVWEGIELPHARNRVAKALDCTNFASIAAEYTGTPEQAMAAIQAYVPSDQREDAPAEQPPLEAPTTDKAEPLGQPCADCGEDTMRRAADGTYRCQACADKRARLERAS
ncbi:MAG TPA: hypothetical protein PKD55_08845 [Bellilinea sp.]|nr:hypothetical protein [Bellilinea sp.]